MKSSKTVESQSMCEELMEKIYSKTTFHEIRDLLITFKNQGVRAPQIAQFLMDIVIKNQANADNEAMPDDVENKLLDVMDMVLGLMTEEFTVWQCAYKWEPGRPIFYLDKLCPACGTGILGFRRLDDEITVVCHECEAVWMQPEKITLENMRRVSESDFMIPELRTSIFGNNAAWATYEEIRMRGWSKYIYGEEIPLY